MAPRTPFDPADSTRRFTSGDPAASNASRADRAFWSEAKRYAPGQQIRQASGSHIVGVVMSGWACEVRSASTPRIYAFLLPGDLIALRDQTVPASTVALALTHVELGPARERASIGQTADVESKILGALRDQNQHLFEQIVRLGALSAEARTAHLLVDFYRRLTAVGLTLDGGFRLPLTQDLFANFLGLSPVHMNRTLQRFRSRRLITLRSGHVALHDLKTLERMAQIEAL